MYVILLIAPFIVWYIFFGEEKELYSLTRLLFRALDGKPVPQIIVGIILIPVGGLISFAAMSSDYIYPYWIIAGIVFAVVGVIFIIRGATTLFKPKPSMQQAMLRQNPYTGPGQYAQQGYASPQYPPQAPYGQPQYYPPPQASYGQPQYYPPPQAPYGQQQNYEQFQYPKQ
jgi:hypothetical protein